MSDNPNESKGSDGPSSPQPSEPGRTLIGASPRRGSLFNPDTPPRTGTPSSPGATSRDLELEHARPSSPINNPSALLVASAAEARAVQHLSETVELDSLVDPSARLRFYRCIDQDLLPALLAPAERTRALEVMQTLFTLLDNALTKGLASTEPDPKFLQIKLTNPAIRKRLDLDAPKSLQKGAPAIDWLHLCGWR